MINLASSLALRILPYVITGAIGFGGGWFSSNYINQSRIANLKQEIAEQAQEFAKYQQRASSEREKLVEEYREKEQRLNNRASTIADLYAKESKEHEKILTQLRADNQRLRGTISGYASGATPSSAATPCDQRASTLGNLLQESTGLLVELGDAAERHAAEVRAFQAFVKAIEDESTP